MSTDIILIAEGNDDDVVLLRNAFQLAGIENETRAVANGEEVICYLKGEGQYLDRERHPFPILLALNLQLERKNGAEVLAWLSIQSNLPRLKLIVLTGAANSREKGQALHLGAEVFLPKPVEPGHLLEVLAGMKNLMLIPQGKGFRLQLATD